VEKNARVKKVAEKKVERKGAHREPEAEGARRGRRGGHPVVRCG
jgi:hypothetical protein